MAFVPRRRLESSPDPTADTMACTVWFVRVATVLGSALNSSMSAPAASASTPAQGTGYPVALRAAADSGSVSTSPGNRAAPAEVL